MEDDKKILEEITQQREKEILEISDKLRVEHGYNSMDNKFGLKTTANGPALVVRGQFDKDKLPEDWEYESNYLLDKDYGQEGIFRMKDGKREFIPIEHEQDSSEIARYYTPNDVRDGILSANFPTIQPDQIRIETTTGKSRIVLINVLNDPICPQGMKIDENGQLVIGVDYNLTFDIVRENAHDSYNTEIAGAKTDTQAVNQSGLQEDAYDHRVQEVKISSADLDLVDFNSMKDIYKRYYKDESGRIVEREKEGSYKTISNEYNDNPNAGALFRLAEIWIESFELASGQSNTEDLSFTGETTEVEFNACIELAKNMSGATLEEYASALFKMDGFENQGVVKTMLYFISNPQISSMFNINCNGMSPQQAIEQVEDLRAQALKSEFMDMVDMVNYGLNNNLRELRDGMDFDSPVMEMKPKNSTY